MIYTNHQSGNGGFITLDNNTEEIGRLTYTVFPDENKLVISFVLVHTKFEGKGMGKYLVDEAVKFAQMNNWKIYPHCSYAKSVLNRRPDAKDLLI